jgi:tetratricopeptide (TPR) repeat protein
MKRLSWFAGIIFIIIIIINSCSNAGEKTDNSIKQQIRQLQDKIAQYPDSSRFYVDLAKIYQFNNRPEDAIQLLKKAKKRFQNDPMVDIWLANAESIMAGKATDVKEKVKWSQYAINDLDATVNKYPDNWMVRYIRARNSMNWPDMFHRKEVAIQDYEYLLSLSKKENSTVPDSLLPEIYYELGMAYKATGLNPVRGEEVLDILVKNFPDSRYAKKVNQNVGKEEKDRG